MIESEKLQDLIPFFVLGGLGGAVRALNENESLRTVSIRIITGSFFATLGGLLSEVTGFPMSVQYAFAGGIGCCASEIMRMLQKKLPKAIGKKIDKKDDCKYLYE
ncbi:hypothetical protein [Pyramidobacter piscolens]|uniref:hypothetical protein n=1 Tax=Pyramidobacter piscolens TaxID=638849 RepID=UPI00058B7901|nr:hypothetical protein [Pyramidobacter piscolens]